MANFKHLDLETYNGGHIFWNEDILKQDICNLYNLLSDQDYMRTLKFAKSMMMSQEIKANNAIEGINDDLSIIDEVIKREKSYMSLREQKRIINLYHGYQYILTHKIIDKTHLKELYKIMSDGILEKIYLDHMGEYYREGPVYILNRYSLSKDPFEGAQYQKIDYYMNKYFEYVNDDSKNMSEIDIFIKSQIMHFYFVYIHPYFDVNGRTSRTLAMWFLLNNKCYPYVIFNRAIAFAQTNYDKNIVVGRKYGNVTLFLKYMLDIVEKELEKAYIINSIEQNSKYNLSKEDLQMLEYFLTLKGNLTAKDLIYFYNHYNEKRNKKEIYEEKIQPLIDKEIFVKLGETKKFISNEIPNIQIRIDEHKVDVNPEKIKSLSLEKYLK